LELKCEEAKDMYEYEVINRAETEKEYSEVAMMVSQNEELEKKLNEMEVTKGIKSVDCFRNKKLRKRK
jgi:hypothetical protein